MKKISSIAIKERIENSILIIRGQKVIIDSVLANLYGVELRVLIQSVKRNIERFPKDFMFSLSNQELRSLRSQIVISNFEDFEIIEDIEQNKNFAEKNIDKERQISQFFSFNKERGGRRYSPYVFTELGVAMLSSVLNSQQAINVNIEIMRAFVKLRMIIASNSKLAKKLDELEKKYDSQFRVVFDAIRELMSQPESKRKQRIGF